MTLSVNSNDDALEALGIASALIKARNDLGLTQADLADQSGISRSAIKGYETGRNMPGSRELRSLCKVLRVSPSMLLFGSETPFAGSRPSADDSPGMRLFIGDPEDAKKARARLAVLGDLLTAEEIEALLRLVSALAIARHGAEVVKEKMLAADFLAAMGIAMQSVAKTDGQVDSEKLQEQVMDFMDRQGHKPKSLK